jgi:hypothetical protein
MPTQGEVEIYTKGNYKNCPTEKPEYEMTAAAALLCICAIFNDHVCQNRRRKAESSHPDRVGIFTKSIVKHQLCFYLLINCICSFRLDVLALNGSFDSCSCLRRPGKLF